MGNTSRHIIRMKDLPAMAGPSRAKIYRMIEDGRFPRPHKLDPEDPKSTAVGWYSDEVEAWINSRPVVE